MRCAVDALSLLLTSDKARIAAAEYYPRNTMSWITLCLFNVEEAEEHS
jgi:hypothetical protein